jgi:HK97 family phage major capsid protein
LVENELKYAGDEVKDLGDGRLGGYLVRFSTANDPDLTGDYFDAKSELNVPEYLPVLYQHGQDETMKRRIIGKGKTKIDEVGVWLDMQMNMRDEYDKAVYEMGAAGKLGLSSGAMPHLVEREQVGKAYHIKSWWIGEASLTPTPAEPRNVSEAIKKDNIKMETKADYKVEGVLSMEAIEAVVADTVAKSLAARENAAQVEAKRISDLEAARVEGAKQAVAELEAKGQLKRAPAVIGSAKMSDDGVAGFMHYIKTGQVNGDLIVDRANIKAAYNITTDASGAYAVPDPLFNQIIAKRDIASWVRQAPVQHFTTDSDHLLIPTEATAQTAFVLTAESAAYSNNEGTLGQTDLKLLKYTKEVRATEEFLAGNNSNAETWLTNTLARAVAVTENTVATTAALATSTAATASASQTATTIAEVMRLIGSLGAGYNVNGECGFLCKNSQKWYLKGVGGTNYQAFDIFAGYPVYVSDDMPAATNGLRSLLFANFNFFALLERPGMSVRRNDFLYMATGQVGLFANIYRGFAGLQALACYTMAQA